MNFTHFTTLLLAVLLAAGCSGAKGVLKHEPTWALQIPIERDPAVVASVLERAGDEMELSLDHAPPQTEGAYVFTRGARLETGGLVFRVDLERIATGTRIKVFATGAGGGSTGETLSKPGDLAYRIVTLALEAR